MFISNCHDDSTTIAGTYYSVHSRYIFGGTIGQDGAIALSPATLTATNTDNAFTFFVKGMQQVVLYLRYTTGSAETNNILNMTVQFSPDGTLYYQEATEEASTTTITEYQATRVFTGASAATAYSLRVAIPVADLDRIRILFHETGVASNFGTLSVLAITSGQ